MSRDKGVSFGTVPQPGSCLLWPWWCPAYRWRELVAGAGAEQENLSSRYRRPVEMGDVGPLVAKREDRKRRRTVSGRVPMRGTGTGRLVVAMKVL